MTNNVMAKNSKFGGVKSENRCVSWEIQTAWFGIERLSICGTEEFRTQTFNKIDQVLHF